MHTALAENQSSIPSTHIGWFTSAHDSRIYASGLREHQHSGAHMHMQTHTCTELVTQWSFFKKREEIAETHSQYCRGWLSKARARGQAAREASWRYAHRLKQLQGCSLWVAVSTSGAFLSFWGIPVAWTRPAWTFLKLAFQYWQLLTYLYNDFSGTHTFVFE